MNVSNIKILPKPECDPEIIEVLEETLAAAKAGEVVGLLLLVEDPTAVVYKVRGIQDRYKVGGFLFHALTKLQSDK